jgi:hypothetical protein
MLKRLLKPSDLMETFSMTRVGSSQLVKPLVRVLTYTVSDNSRMQAIDQRENLLVAA